MLKHTRFLRIIVLQQYLTGPSNLFMQILFINISSFVGIVCYMCASCIIE